MPPKRGAQSVQLHVSTTVYGEMYVFPASQRRPISDEQCYQPGNKRLKQDGIKLAQRVDVSMPSTSKSLEMPRKLSRTTTHRAKGKKRNQGVKRGQYVSVDGKKDDEEEVHVDVENDDVQTEEERRLTAAHALLQLRGQPVEQVIKVEEMSEFEIIREFVQRITRMKAKNGANPGKDRRVRKRGRPRKPEKICPLHVYLGVPPENKAGKAQSGFHSAPKISVKEMKHEGVLTRRARKQMEATDKRRRARKVNRWQKLWNKWSKSVK